METKKEGIAGRNAINSIENIKTHVNTSLLIIVNGY
jgi:hypothetical protein